MGKLVRAVLLACVLASSIGHPIARAQDTERTTGSTNFEITWVDDPSDPDAPELTDDDADGIPDSIEAALDAFERARSFVVDGLGYRAPPVADLYPIYLGQAAATFVAPGGIGRSRPSYIVFPPGALQPGKEDARDAIAVHEYFHAVQLGYDARELDWINEASSVWMEGQFDPSSGRLGGYVEGMILEPRVPLDDGGGGHEYSAFLFFQYLSERFGGPEIVRELWEDMAVPEGFPGATDSDPYAALGDVLARRGTSFAESWAEFMLWMRRPAAHFAQGDSYLAALDGRRAPLVRRSAPTDETCRLRAGRDEKDLVTPLSSAYARLKPSRRGPRRATAVLTVSSSSPGIAASVAVRGRDGVSESTVPVDATGTGSITVPFGRADVKNVTVAMGNASLEGDAALIAYSLRIVGRPATETSTPSGASSTIYGTAGALFGSVTCDGEPAPFADVTITQREVSTGAVQELHARTGANGIWSLPVAPEARSTYDTELSDPLLSSAPSDGEHTMAVRLAMTIDAGPDRPALAEPVAISGQVIPAHPGAVVLIQYRRPEREWRDGPDAVVDGSGASAARLTLPRPGIWLIRVVGLTTGDDDHEPGDSAVRTVQVERA